MNIGYFDPLSDNDPLRWAIQDRADGCGFNCNGDVLAEALRDVVDEADSMITDAGTLQGLTEVEREILSNAGRAVRQRIAQKLTVRP